MKRKTLISILAIIIVLGACYGYKEYNSQSKKQSSINNATSNDKAKPKDADKKASDDKLKKVVSDAVAKAESSKTQADIDKARSLVGTLPADADKDDLNKRLDKISIAGEQTSNSVPWIKAPEYNGIKTTIEGTVDVKKVKTVKAFVDDKEVTVVFNKDGSFLIVIASTLEKKLKLKHMIQMTKK